MGGLKDFKVIFDNPATTYYGGQVVSGRVYVKLTEQKKIRGIELKFQGEADVQWTETRTVRDSDGKSHTVTDYYKAHECYFEEKCYILGGAGQEMTLPVGDHNYPFHKQLPACVPSSFEGEHGHIRYTVKATLDRPWKFDHDTNSSFTVLAHLDLNQESHIKEPFKQEKHKYLCCCCCKSGPITMVILLPVTGFVPGQCIPITVEVDNNTEGRISDVHFKLTKVSKFHASSPHNKTLDVKNEITSLSFGPVLPNGSNTWAKDMSIPSLVPSYLKYCSIMDVEYHLKGTAAIDGCHFDLDSRNIPIVIGTIPLIEYAAPGPTLPTFMPSSIPSTVPSSVPSAVPSDIGFVDGHWNPPPSFNEAVGGDGDKPGFGWNVMPSAPMDPSAPSASSAPSAPLFSETTYPDIPPPTFEESILGQSNMREKDSDQHTQEQKPFIPPYPTSQLAMKTFPGAPCTNP